MRCTVRSMPARYRSGQVARLVDVPQRRPLWDRARATSPRRSPPSATLAARHGASALRRGARRVRRCRAGGGPDHQRQRPEPIAVLQHDRLRPRILRRDPQHLRSQPRSTPRACRPPITNASSDSTASEPGDRALQRASAPGWVVHDADRHARREGRDRGRRAPAPRSPRAVNSATRSTACCSKRHAAIVGRHLVRAEPFGTAARQHDPVRADARSALVSSSD